jgi:STE24 endopeptidase
LNEDRATRYHRLSRRASVLGLLLSTAFLGAIVLTGAAAALRDVARTATSAFPSALGSLAAVAVFVLLLALIHEAVSFPLAFYRGHLLDRRYGLTVQTTGAWLRDHLKAAGIGLVFAIAGCEVIYAALRIAAVVVGDDGARAERRDGGARAGRAGRASCRCSIASRRSIARTRCASGSSACARAGANVVGAHEWKLSDRTVRANAALTGLGATRRILLSDTLLAGARTTKSK